MQVVRNYVQKAVPVEILQYDGKNYSDLLVFCNPDPLTANAVYMPGLNQVRLSMRVRKVPKVRAGLSIPNPVEALVNIGDIIVKYPDGTLKLMSVEEIQNEFDQVKE